MMYSLSLKTLVNARQNEHTHHQRPQFHSPNDSYSKPPLHSLPPYPPTHPPSNAISSWVLDPSRFEPTLTRSTIPLSPTLFHTFALSLFLSVYLYIYLYLFPSASSSTVSQHALVFYLPSLPSIDFPPTRSYLTHYLRRTFFSLLSLVLSLTFLR